jgi:hypothetical protein
MINAINKITASFAILIHIQIYFQILTLIEAKCERENSREIRSFTIDLDKPARERFKESSAFYKEELWAWFNTEKLAY